ncbi:MAG TPA: response regulator transcription factor [Bryobacteraceae bacterium]|nr:response regulator transcription factor [Bryobacteraceae bacterium]
MRLLVVEDDQRLARQLKKGVEEQGHACSLAFDGPTGLESARQGPFDALVLDVMLPGIDGFTLVRRLRDAGYATPILLLTARDSPEDIVTGLDAGADDYLTKPFSLKVLLARLRALVRRREGEPSSRLRIGEIVLDPAAHSVTRDGAPIALTRTEFLLLEALMRSAGRVLTRDRLIAYVWGNEREIESNTLDVFVRQLRAKLELPGSRKLVQTIRGVGYVIREEEFS